MSRKPVSLDHGGNSYKTGRMRGAVIRKSSIYSFRCLDCGSLRYVTPVELTRASRPRCLKCGGPIEETDPSHKRHVARSDELRIAKGHKTSDTPDCDLLPKDGQSRVCKKCGGPITEEKLRCKGCGALYQKAIHQCSKCSLVLHHAMKVSCKIVTESFQETRAVVQP